MEVELLEAFEELPQELRPPLLKVVKALQRAIGETVKRQDFIELKSIVADLGEAQKKTEARLNELAEAQKKTEARLNELAEAQKKTEARLNELAEAQKKTEARLSELAEAQKKTEARVNELAEAQKKTEARLNQLAEAQKKTETRLNELAEAQKKTEEEIRKLTVGLRRVRKDVGGLSRSVAYALENEAFRHLPAFLKKHYNIEILDRMIRTEIEGEEINLFCKIRKNGEEGYIVGESVLKLDDKSKLRQVWKKVEVVKETYGGMVIPILITHFAKKNLLDTAKKAGIIVVQSFEWS